jgi:hypothetical protein
VLLVFTNFIGFIVRRTHPSNRKYRHLRTSWQHRRWLKHFLKLSISVWYSLFACPLVPAVAIRRWPSRTASIDTSALVGSTAGGLSINQGAANYTIPITVPPGIAGMQPELSINYNSNTGNGQLGVGFSLGGLSIIHRCSKTIATVTHSSIELNWLLSGVP